MTYKLDMSMMFAMHDALRRDLERSWSGSRAGWTMTRRSGCARRLYWELFKRFLVNHHESEDEALSGLRCAPRWPPTPTRRRWWTRLRPEHAVIDPLLAAIDAAVADPDGGRERFGGLVDELIIELSAHLMRSRRKHGSC